MGRERSCGGQRVVARLKNATVGPRAGEPGLSELGLVLHSIFEIRRSSRRAGDDLVALVRWLTQLISGLEGMTLIPFRPRNLLRCSALVLFFDVTPERVSLLGAPYLCVLDSVRHGASNAPPSSQANVVLTLALAPHRDQKQHENSAKHDSRTNPHAGHFTPPLRPYPRPRSGSRGRDGRQSLSPCPPAAGLAPLPRIVVSQSAPPVSESNNRALGAEISSPDERRQARRPRPVGEEIRHWMPLAAPDQPPTIRSTATRQRHE